FPLLFLILYISIIRGFSPFQWAVCWLVGRVIQLLCLRVYASFSVAVFGALCLFDDRPEFLIGIPFLFFLFLASTLFFVFDSTFNSCSFLQFSLHVLSN